MRTLVACAAIAWTLMGATVAPAQAPAKSLGPLEAYRAAAEKQVVELKAKAGSNGGADTLGAVKETYEAARTLQAAWVETLKAAAAGTQTNDQVEAAGASAAQAVFACVQARRAALGQPALTDKLAGGVQDRVLTDYRADGPKRVRALKNGGPDATRSLDEALLWKEWEAVK